VMQSLIGKGKHKTPAKVWIWQEFKCSPLCLLDSSQ
jgi:hypothetical protein